MMPIFDTYLVYALHPDLPRMKIHPRLVGKYILHDGLIHVVEDHDGVLDGLDQQPLAQQQSRIDSLMNSHYYLVDKKKPANEQKEVDDWENEVFADSDAADGGQIQKPARDGVFHYHREGYSVPRVLEAKGGNLTLDGSDVSREEVQAMLDNAKKGAAKITYVKPPAFADFKKSALRAFEAFAPLRKAVPLNDVFANLRELVDAGHLHPEYYNVVRRELYQDEMIPSLGNKRAYRDFMAGNEAKGGVHVMLDGDGMKAINDTHGHEAGDKAIQSLGNSLRSAIDQSVGQDNAKAHRFGGDEFHFWTKTPEQAHLVLRQLHENLAKLPPVGGTHKVGFSAGLGENPGIADAALGHAKDSKRDEIAQALAQNPKMDPRMVQPTKPLRVHSLLKPQPTTPLENK
jgi:diguanylate cyclase (GGDEF)-like protein